MVEFSRWRDDANIDHIGGTNRRAALRQASVMVSALNGDLQQLVPEFGKPIAGHVNFRGSGQGGGLETCNIDARLAYGI